MNLTRLTKDRIRCVSSHWPAGLFIAAAFLGVIAGCQSEIASPGTTDETNTGRIVGPGGSSAPGAEIRVFALADTTGQPLLVDTADAYGGYDPTRLRDGIYNMIASKGDLELFRDSILLGPGATPRVDTLSRPGSLRGRVVLEPGHDPRTVYVRAMGTNLYVNVGEDGSFEFPRIAQGDYTLLATTTLPDYTPTFLAVRAYEDSSVTLAKPIRLVYTGKDLRIHTPDGSRAAGALIRIFKPDDTSGNSVFTTVADGGGRYEIAGLPVGVYNILATSGDLALFRDSVLLSSKAERADTLGHPGSLRGRIELEPGDDPREVTLRIAGTAFQGNVDSIGGFLFPTIPVGTYVLRASVALPKYMTTNMRVSVYDDSAAALREPIRMIYTGLGPRIVRPDGSPAAGAEIRVFPPDAFSGTPAYVAIADNGGRYDLAGLAFGRYNLLVESGDYMLFRSLVIGDPAVVRVDTLERPGALHGAVGLPRGIDAGSFSVQVMGTGLWSGVDSAGRFQFPKVPAGSFTMAASTSLPDFRSVPRAVQVVGGSSISIAEPLRMDYFGPPAVSRLNIAYDTARGLVRLTWPRTAGAAGYQVIRPEGGSWGTSPRFVSTVETTFVDSVMMLTNWGNSIVSLLPAGGGTYRVCATGEDGTKADEWACASGTVQPPAEMYGGRRSGMRWSKLGSMPWINDYGITAGYSTLADISIQPRGDSLWLFLHRGDNGDIKGMSSSTIPRVRNRISAWKSPDGVHWQLVADSLQVDTWWTDYGSFNGGRQMPQFWNDTLWGLRRVADTLQLVASVDGKSWEEVPLPRKYLVNQPYRGYGGIVYPTLLATPYGLALFFYTSWAPDQSGCLRDAQGRWQEPAPRLDRAYYQEGYGDVTTLATISGIWKLFESGGMNYEKSALTENWIERLDGPTSGLRRPLPRGPEQLTELDGLLYLPSSRRAVGDAYTSVFLVTDRDADVPWWYVEVPEGAGMIMAFAWKKRLLAVAQNGDLWAGEPTEAP